jgi:hypothetical protein
LAATTLAAAALAAAALAAATLAAAALASIRRCGNNRIKAEIGSAYGHRR